MSKRAELEARWAKIPGLCFVDHGELIRMEISNDAAEAALYLHGAHICHYQPRGKRSLLWTSDQAVFTPGAAIRGGIPICWPAFADEGQPVLPKHGFVRTRPWRLTAVRAVSPSVTEVECSFQSDHATHALWPYDFALRFVISIGAQLDVALHIHNTGNNDFDWSGALHTYFPVSDIHAVRVTGLDGVMARNSLADRAYVQQTGPIAFTEEYDRIFINTTSGCRLEDPGYNDTIVVDKRGSESTVVWNPWTAKAQGMSDFGDEEWTGMLCIETAQAADNRHHLVAGAQHTLATTIGLCN